MTAEPLGGCFGNKNVIICSPRHMIVRRIRLCPTCKKRRRFVETVAMWYDPTFTCCGCGDSWEGEYRMGRPFERGWRNEAIARAKKQWEKAVTHEEANEWLRREIKANVG